MNENNNTVPEKIDNNIVPEEIKGWNWGAFTFQVFWGIGNKAYLSLLSMIPIFNIVWIFVVGFKGNSWAWEKGDYQDVESFKTIQSTWNRAGLVMFIINIFGILIFVWGILHMLNM